jgi:LytS/YehU family sensor histidine kinase
MQRRDATISGYVLTIIKGLLGGLLGRCLNRQKRANRDAKRQTVYLFAMSQ